MISTMRLLALALFISCVFFSCAREKQPVDLVTFPLRGKVVGIDSTAHRVTVSHEAIPDYMPAMTMPFKIKDLSLLNRIAVGDSIGATLAVSRTESWLETIQVLRRGENVNAMTPEEIEFKHLYRDGETIPDLKLVNQDGNPLQVSTFRGKTLVLTFIYTRCPLPDFCIRMSQQFADLQRILKSDQALNGRWHLLSISFDPSFDRPAVLRQYGMNYGADFSVWDFATDPDTAGNALGKFVDGFGLTYAPSEGLIDHNLRTAVINPEGKLVKVFRGNDWKVEDLVAVVKESA